MLHSANETKAGVADEDARQKASLAKNLKTVANPKHKSA